jgi:transcriptional regulator with XRE-family HTH domain
MTTKQTGRTTRRRSTDPDPKTTGTNLRQIRIDREVTQTQLADILGYKTHAGVAHIESGYRGMTQLQVEKAAKFLGVAPSLIRAAK